MTYKLKDHVTNDIFVDVVYEVETEDDVKILIDLCNQLGINTDYARDNEVIGFHKLNDWGNPRLYKVRNKYNTYTGEYALVWKYVSEESPTYINRKKFKIQDLIELGYVEEMK